VMSAMPSASVSSLKFAIADSYFICALFFPKDWFHFFGIMR